MQFFLHEFYDIFAEARTAVSAFVGADPEGVVFGVNTTTLVGGVLRSISLKPGDEILIPRPWIWGLSERGAVRM